MKLKFLLISFTLLIFSSLNAQEKVGDSFLTSIDAKEQFLKQKKDLEGVYQVQFVNVRGTLGLTSEMLNFIEENQKETEDLIIQYSRNIRLVIRSKQSIENKNFFSEDERVVYVVN